MKQGLGLRRIPGTRRCSFPYLNGEDLNSSPRFLRSSMGHRLQRLGRKAKLSVYELPYKRVLDHVKPERAKNKRRRRDGSAWWLFARDAPGYAEGDRRPRRGACHGTGEQDRHANARANWTRCSVTTGVIRDRLVRRSGGAVIKPASDVGDQVRFEMRSDPRYTPSDVFERFPRPSIQRSTADVGKTLDTERREIMLRRELGLTKLYNLVNDPDYTDDDIDRMRQIHVELDQAVMDAYGWGDVPLDHGFHTYRQMQRWTVSPGRTGGDPGPAPRREPAPGRRPGRGAATCRGRRRGG